MSISTSTSSAYAVVSIRPTAFVSAAIPYVNAKPHLGHALGFVLAETLAESLRQTGHQVWLTSGTDDNSLKCLRAADAHGVSPETWVADNAEAFRKLINSLGVRPDVFIRTSQNPKHTATVRALWLACEANGDFYLNNYHGLYCHDCERFFGPSEASEAQLCPEHQRPLTPVSERNIFFRLSRYGAKLRELVSSGQLRIEPEFARRETLAWLDAGLDDISISRQREGSAAPEWGIPVPGLKEHTVWVWFDALANYLTSVDFADGGENYVKFWQRAERRVHVVGKGITRFHTVLWPAFLLSAGVLPPTDIFVHSYITLAGSKISKSGGNAFDPTDLLEKYGQDPVRYFLLNHVRPHRDSDFSAQRFETAYATELAANLGNLVHRVSALLRSALSLLNLPSADPLLPSRDELPQSLAELLRQAERTVRDASRHWKFQTGIQGIFQLLTGLNGHLEQCAPWRQLRELPILDPGESTTLTQLRQGLGSVIVCLQHSGHWLKPYLPDTASKIEATLGVGQPCEAPLFPRLDGTNETSGPDKLSTTV